MRKSILVWISHFVYFRLYILWLHRFDGKKHTHTRSLYTGVTGIFNSSANSCTWKSTVQQINGTTGGYFNEKIRFADKTIAFGSNTSSGKCFEIQKTMKKITFIFIRLNWGYISVHMNTFIVFEFSTGLCVFVFGRVKIGLKWNGKSKKGDEYWIVNGTQNIVWHFALVHTQKIVLYLPK